MHTEGTARITRVLGYARVSSAEQALGTSLEDQQNSLSAYAAKRGLKVSRFFVEAESAIYEKFERREQVQYLMREARKGDLVLVDKVDRLSRDPEFTYRSVRELREKGAKIYFVEEAIDPDTPEGDSMLGMRAYYAREEHKRIRIRTVGTRRALRDRGYYAEGLPPLGYARSKPRGYKGIDKNVLVIVEEWAAIVRDIYKRCVRGHSISDIVQHLRDTKQGRVWDKKQIGTILRNRIYLGEVKNSQGVWIKGMHKPIIDETTFAKAQMALTGRRLAGPKPREDSRTSTWLLRMISVCGKCGGRIAAAYGGGLYGKTEYIYYYRCGKSCGARYAPVKPQDEAAAQMVLHRLVEIRELLARSQDAPTSQAQAPDFEAQRERLAKRRERFLDSFGDGLISKEELHARLAKIDTERARIDAAEAAQKRPSALAQPKARRAMLGLVQGIELSWRKASPAIRRQILADLAIRVRIERGKKPVVEWRSIDDLAGNLLPET